MLNADKFEYQNYNTLKMLNSKYYYINPPNLIRVRGQLRICVCVCVCGNLGL